MRQVYTRARGRGILLPAMLFVLCGFAFSSFGQNTYTFTNCGATGSVGPSQTQITNTYSNTNLAGQVTATTNGIQTWTVPYSGNFRIEAHGAQGGNASSAGGLGASMTGDFALNAGEVIMILVGQQGENGSSSQPGGGGGGSYVVRAPYNTTTAILVIAGGGTGHGSYPAVPGLTTTSGGNAPSSGGLGGVNGNGGGGGSRGAGGGGFFTNGGPCTVNTAYASPGSAFVNGGLGGPRTNHSCGFTSSGGFGGGSSHGGNCIANGGAGGGFSGGGGSYNNSSGAGGSFNNGTNQVNIGGNNSGHGRVIITELCSISLVSSASNSLNPTICAGQSLTLTTNAVSNYSWSTGATSSSLVVSPTQNTVYSLVATSPSACSAGASISVTVSSGVPTISIVNSNPTVCIGQAALLTASGALTYTWTNSVTNAVAFFPSATNVYTVSGENGCGVTTGTTQIDVGPLPAAITSATNAVCAGNALSLSVTAVATSYTWEPGNIVTTNTTQAFAPGISTIYTVTATDGTCIGTATLGVTAHTLPMISVVGTSTNICSGQSVTITVTGGDNYTWTPSSLSGSVVVVTPNVASAYQVIGDNAMGCIAAGGHIVLVQQPPTITTNLTSTVICVGGTVKLTASGAGTYTWNHGPQTNTVQVAPTTSTLYVVTGTSPQNTCTSSRSYVVSVYEPVLGVSPSTAVCHGAAVSFTAGPGNNFSWNPGGSTFSSVNFTAAASTVYTVNASVTGSGVTCPASNTIQLTVNPNPTIGITAPSTVICRNDAVVLTASGADTYAWSNSTVTASMFTFSSNIAVTHNVNVTGTDANGCTDSETIQVRVNSCTGLAEGRPDESILVYPVPSHGELFISSASDISLSLVNTLGQVVSRFNLNKANAHQVQLKDLSAGVYFITNAEGTFSRKVIVE